MKNWKKILKCKVVSLISLLVLTQCSAREGREVDTSLECTLAITSVDIVPMNTDQILRDRTVFINGGKIVKIMPSLEASPESCDTLVNGSGRFLSPGLNDLHTHIETEAFPAAFDLGPMQVHFEAALAPYLANGITGLRVMSGAPDILEFRRQQEAANLALPLLVVATPMLSGEPPIMPEPLTKIVSTPDQAREVVREFASQGYDFVKIRRNLGLDVYKAVLEEATGLGLDVDGHLLRNSDFTVFDILKSGQKGVAHLDELALLVKKEDYPQLISLLKECDCYVSSAINVSKNISRQITDYEEMITREEMRFVSPLIAHAFWLKPSNPYLANGASPEFFNNLFEDSKALLIALENAGVVVVSGSDALNPMLIPGYSLIDELEVMVDSGLSPYQALRTSTTNPSLAVPGFQAVGVIEAGRIANMVLLTENPLNHVGAYRAPEAVIINGKVISKEEMEGKLMIPPALQLPEAGNQ